MYLTPEIYRAIKILREGRNLEEYRSHQKNIAIVFRSVLYERVVFEVTPMDALWS
jgi:hypothetical protein